MHRGRAPKLRQNGIPGRGNNVSNGMEAGNRFVCVCVCVCVQGDQAGEEDRAPYSEDLEGHFNLRAMGCH